MGATPVRGSLGDVDLLRELAGQADAVLHLGYDPQHPAAGDIDAAAVDALLAGVRRGAPVIYGSATVVYGDTGAEPIDDDPPAHLTPHAQQRIDVERQVLSATAPLDRWFDPSSSTATAHRCSRCSVQRGSEVSRGGQMSATTTGRRFTSTTSPLSIRAWASDQQDGRSTPRPGTPCRCGLLREPTDPPSA
jgi:hypothetical protein